MCPAISWHFSLGLCNKNTCCNNKGKVQATHAFIKRKQSECAAVSHLGGHKCTHGDMMEWHTGLKVHVVACFTHPFTYSSPSRSSSSAHPLQKHARKKATQKNQASKQAASHSHTHTHTLSLSLSLSFSRYFRVHTLKP
jgi:hypothetical protein